MSKKLRLLVALAATILTLGALPASASVDLHAWPLQTLLRVDSDPSIGYEQIPHGVPTYYSWYDHAVVTNATDANGYGYANPWGYVYNVATGNPEPTAHVQLRYLQMWTLSKSTGQWTALYASPPNIGGALYPEAFNGSPVCAALDYSHAGTVISNPNTDCHGNAVTGRVWHFYPGAARAAVVDPSDVAAIAVKVQARISPDDPAWASYPGYVVAVGADWWSAASGGSVNGAGSSRMVTVAERWRDIVWTTEPLSQLATQALPPMSCDPGECF